MSMKQSLSPQGQVFLDQLDMRSGPGTPANPTMEYYLAMRAWMLRMEKAMEEVQKNLLDIQALQQGQRSDSDKFSVTACSDLGVHRAHRWGMNALDEYLCLGRRNV